MPEPEDRPEWNPGGWAAKKKGCTCSRLDNRFGEGAGMPAAVWNERFVTVIKTDDKTFIVENNCPLHADTPYPSSNDLGSEGVASSE